MMYEFKGLHSQTLLSAYMQFESRFKMEEEAISVDIAIASKNLLLPESELALVETDYDSTDGLTTFRIVQRVGGKVATRSISGYVRKLK